MMFELRLWTIMKLYNCVSRTTRTYIFIYCIWRDLVMSNKKNKRSCVLSNDMKGRERNMENYLGLSKFFSPFEQGS